MRIVMVGTGTQAIGQNSKTAVEIVINNLAREFQELGNEVEIIDIFDSQTKRDKHLKYIIIRMPKFLEKIKPNPGSPLHLVKKFIFSFKTLFALKKLQKQKKEDIIHIQNQYPGYFITLFKKIFKNSKIVYTSHTPFWTLSKEEFKKKYFFKTILERACMKKADKVIAVGEYQRKCIIDKSNLSSDKIIAIRNGVDIDKFKPLFLKKNGKEMNIICVARISRIKNQLTLVKAMPQLLKINKDIKLTLLGQLEEGDYVQEIKEFIKQNNLEKNVKLAGAVDNNLLPEKYAASDIFVSASTGEGLPLTVLEAMASGLAIELSNIGPHLELKEENIDYFSPYDEKDIAIKLSKLIKNKEKLKKMCKISRKIAEKEYSWRKVAEKNIAVYKKLLN